MVELRDRFALTDGLTTPDLWPRVEARAKEIGSQERESHGREGISRIVAAGVALVVFAAASVLAWDAFSRVGRSPATQRLPFGAVELPGVPFVVCRPMSIPGDFGASWDTEWVFGQGSESDGCDVVVARYVGIGTHDAVAILSEPVLDHDLRGQDLWPFAAADVNGDGIDEVAIGVATNDTPTRFALYRLDGRSIVRITWCVDCGALVDWGGPHSHLGGSFQGAFCQQHDGSPVFSTWDVELSDDRTRLVGWLIDYSLVGSRFEETARTTIDVPAADPGTLPQGGRSALCGSPVHPASDFGY
jgi:hypothetical protein